MLPLQRLTPLLLVALFGIMAWSASPHVGVTFDETAHLTAGYSYWTTDDYRLQPENGNLPQRWAALPLVFGDWNAPQFAGHSWDQADVWSLGREFFFHSGNDTDTMLLAGRGMIMLFALALAATAYSWSRDLFGRTGGLITLGFVSFSPSFLANGALITSDMAASLGFLLALGAWWRLCHRVTVGRIVLTGLAMGFLALSKYSAALFVPVALLMLIVRGCRDTPLSWHWRKQSDLIHGPRRLAALIGAGTLSGALAITLIWSAYGFRYAASPGDGRAFTKPWSEVLIEQPVNSTTDYAELKPGVVQHFVGWARGHEVLPEAWLYGLAFTDLHARGRLAYFSGDYRTTGWWEFFPLAFVLKSTLPTLILLGLACFAFVRTKPSIRSRLLYRLTPLLLFVGVYWIFAITSHLNIGHRHLLPIYAPLFIIAGVIGSQCVRRRSRMWALAAGSLFVWHTAESVWVRPHYLTYFNEIAGGPNGGHRYFVDSSLDWGQGLPDLKTWLETHPHDERVFLSYFGSDDPGRLGIRATRIGDTYFNFSRHPILPPLTGGTYCLSATMLHCVYTQVRGPWSDDYENEYRALAHEIVNSSVGKRCSTGEIEMFEQLRFGRLCHFLRQRRPDAIAGNVFFIYRLDDDEIDIALNHPWRPVPVP